MTDNVLELREVTKRYGDFTAVDRVDLDVPAGSIYGFLGPNGAGKTTTLRMILEIIKPTSGTITVLGHSSALAVRQRIGYLPEEKGLYKKMKAWSIVAYFASLKGLSRRDAAARAHELLERYGLGEFANARTEALSKGMSQKVQVLAAIAHDPDLVILDEPFSGLDPVNQQVMEQVIEDMASRGKTILFSTHVMQHAERICDRILLIASGRKVFDGSIEAAKMTMPPRVRLTSDDDVTPLLLLDGVLDGQAVQDDGAPPGTWDLTVEEGLDSQSLLQVCFESGIRLKNFDRSDPTLHDVFVHLVGRDAAEVRHR
ncbi:MAG: ATP-binding cassette domain-containing protein [Acidobacteriota bacterium]|nr:ATP-binding cassette domain-containing protein [Acidobacteriota bacterium]